MSVTNFINISLGKISKMFPEAKIEYQYDNPSETHFIKVTPSEIYTNREFAKLDIELNESFEGLGINEELCFITSDSLIQLDAPSKILMPTPIYEFSSVSVNQKDKIFVSSNEMIELYHDTSSVRQELASFIFDSNQHKDTPKKHPNRRLAMAA